MLDAHKGVSYSGDAWRIVREERDVLQGFPSKARWDPDVFDVLYMYWPAKAPLRKSTST